MLKKYYQVKLHSIPFKNEVIQQIGINIGSLPKVDSLKHLVVWAILVNDRRQNPLKINMPPPFLSSFMWLNLGTDV